MAAFIDNCRFIPTAGGTTDFVYSSAVGGCQSPSAAGAVNGVKYKCRAESADLTQWELFEGAYNSSTGTFPRTTVLYNSSGTGTAAGQSGAGTKINFSTVPQVAVVGLAEDLISVEVANSFTTAQKTQARSNIGVSGVTARVHLGASQSVTSGAATKIAFDTVDFDATGAWNSTNHNFNPQQAGTYLVTLAVAVTGTFTAGSTVLEAFIGKNGLYSGNSNANAQAESFVFAESSSATQIPGISTLVQLNGSTDTVEGDVLLAGTSPMVQGVGVPNIRTYMTIARIGD